MSDLAATPPSLWGMSLTNFGPSELDRVVVGADAWSSSSSFPYERAVAAIAIVFARATIRVRREDYRLLRVIFAVLLGYLTYTGHTYERITSVHLLTFAISYILGGLETYSSTTTTILKVLMTGVQIAISVVVSFGFSNLLFTGVLGEYVGPFIPPVFIQGLEYMFPIPEFVAAYKTIEGFANDKALFQHSMAYLLFVTFHVQTGMGFLGIDFLRAEQGRRNMLVRLDVDGDEPSTGEENDANTTKNHVKWEGGGPHTVGQAQQRRLQRSRRFQRSALSFILFSALPYMLQIIAFGNLNKFAFLCVQHDLHRMIRVHNLFQFENRLAATVTETTTSPEAYATSMDKVFETVYEAFNRKLFSLPKLLLLPAVMSRQPSLIVQVFPFIFLSDWVKANSVAYMTAQIENWAKEIHELSSIRTKVESFDLKNAELLQRSGRGTATFTRRRWEELTVAIQSRQVVSDLMTRSKDFFSFMQRNFVFTVLIDCALAYLIAVGKIVSGEIFVFSRAIEDFVDVILMRSRSEAELARLLTEKEKLDDLADIWKRSEISNVLPCNLPTHQSYEHNHKNALVLRNLHYSRGTAVVRADHIELYSGVYALTGANGSGKSTLFRVLMSCSTNDKSVDLPSSINLLTPTEILVEYDDIMRKTACESADATVTAASGEFDISSSETEVLVDENGNIELLEAEAVEEKKEPVVPRLSITMPSSHVVEISQTFYWPLYTKPLNWIYQDHITETLPAEEVKVMSRKVAEALNELHFFQSAGLEEVNRTAQAEVGSSVENNRSEAISEATILRIMSELEEEKEDWFSDLSGGQKSKVELVRKVFMHDHCPDLLLVDETMAPLDPASKALVMEKLKTFCHESIIIVIYHTDVGRDKQQDDEFGGVSRVECVPSNDFFDKNIHLEKGLVTIRETC